MSAALPSQRTVMIVDDEVHIVNVVALKLRHAGFQVLTAYDPDQALSLTRQHAVDLVITDHHMPGGSGVALCRLLRADPATADVPVVLLTAYDFSIVQDEIGDCNVQAIMAKPFSPRELLDLIVQVLGGVRQQSS